MSSRRRMSSAAAKRALLASAAVILFCSGHAWAQTPGATPAPRTSPDGLAEGELYMEADEVVRDDKAGITTATGSVEIRYDDRTVRADKIVYTEGKTEGQGVVRAYGDVQIISDNGDVQFADEVTLDDKMRMGVALGFSARLQQNIKIAAASALRRSDVVQELNRAIYTPCEVCASNGAPKAPTWSIAAERVVQDKKKRIILYKNARLRVKGVSLLYLPVFWHADPQAKRASGLLAPSISASDRRGFSYEQPYLWVISPYSDLTISPQINAEVNPLLNGELRKRFYTGEVNVRFGVTRERDFDGQGTKFGDRTNRSYILGRGSFQVDEKWRWGFTAERTSDDYLFDKYETSKVYESRGPYVADDRRLISQLYALRQDQRSYFSAAMMSIQGLRPGDNDRTFPLVAPLVESHYEPAGSFGGGRLRFHGSAVSLQREQAPENQALRLPGLDSQRISLETDWRRTFTSQAGMRVEPFINLRVDGYRLHDILTGVGASTRAKSATRGLAVAGLDLSYPVYRRWNNATLVLEPLAQLAVSPNAHQIVVSRDAAGNPIYLNEDSLAFEFDETTLFRANKFPGYDLYEDGARLNVAGRGSILWDDGRRASVLVGRSFRTKANDVFSPRSGLRGKSSDWIVAANAAPMQGLSLFGRARLDSDTLSIHRLEAGANVYNRFGSGYIRYLTDDFDVNLLPAGAKRENLDVGGEIYIGKNWGVTAAGSRDITQGAWVIRDIGAFYRDDCVRMDVIYRREDSVLGRLGPRDQISVRLTLATLGAPIYVR